MVLRNQKRDWTILTKNTLLHLFRKRLIQAGNITAAYRLIYNVLAALNTPDSSKCSALAILEHAVICRAPKFALKTVRIRGAVHKVPVHIRLNKATSISIQWIINCARCRQENGMLSKITNEIIDANCGFGGAINKRNDLHRIAEANKAFVRL